MRVEFRAQLAPSLNWSRKSADISQIGLFIEILAHLSIAKAGQGGQISA